MSALLESLLTPGQRAQAAMADQPSRRAVDRVAPPPVPSRADKIIKAGDDARREFRDRHPGADQAMVYGAQVGHLHAMVRELCNELEMFKDTVASGLESMEVEASVGALTVGYTYEAEIPDRITSARHLELTGDPGHPGSAASVNIEQVLCNGVDLYRWVPGDELDKIADEVLERHEIRERIKRERDAARADERGAA